MKSEARMTKEMGLVISLNSEVGQRCRRLLAWGRHSCLPVGATFQSPQAGLESPANRQAGKPAPHCLAPYPGPQLRNSGLKLWKIREASIPASRCQESPHRKRLARALTLPLQRLRNLVTSPFAKGADFIAATSFPAIPRQSQETPLKLVTYSDSFYG